jgi:predicted enzyme related to lactoylglutathione lyase
MIARVEILSCRILLHPTDLERSHRFYRDELGLAIYREFGPPETPGIVYFVGQGLLEVSGHAPNGPRPPISLWLQVRDVRAEHVRLQRAGVNVTREPRQEPWGLLEMWIEDPDGVRIVLVQIPHDHPLRRDQR